MSIYGITTNYDGRLVDLEILQSVQQPGVSQQVELGLSSQPVRKVTGVQKAIQRYVILFNTILGAIKFVENQGTDFIKEIVSGTIQVGDVPGIFAIANSTVLTYMAEHDRQYEAGAGITTPDDEVLTSASLLDYSVDYSTATLSMQIEIKTRAGDNLLFTLPIRG